MRNYNMIEIDGNALRYELDKKGIRMKDLSAELGMSDGYIKNSVASNRIRLFVLKYLEETYGINPEKYLLREEKKEEKESESENVPRETVTMEDVSEILGELRKINESLAKIILQLN